MCRMLGAMCNDEDLLGCAIHEVKDSVRLTGDGHHDGIGVGYYRQDEPLLMRRPRAATTEIDYTQLVEGIASNTLIVHVRKGTVGAWKDTNTHPFRFRKWLFAHVGHLPAIERNREAIVAGLQPFLSRNVMGDTDSETAFHMFLEIVHQNGKINDLTLSAEQLGEYLQRCVGQINEHHALGQSPQLAILVTNGQVMAAACQGVSMHYSHREGILECPRHEPTEHNQQIHHRFKGIMLGAEMANPGHQWREVANGSLLFVSKKLELKVQSL